MSDEPKKLGLKKALTICAAGLTVSLGLCGVNVVAAAFSMRYGGSSREDLFFTTGYIELAGIIAFGLGLVVTFIVAIVGSVIGHFKTKTGDH